MLKHPIQSIRLFFNWKHLARILFHVAPSLPQLTRLVSHAKRNDTAGTLHHASTRALAASGTQSFGRAGGWLGEFRLWEVGGVAFAKDDCKRFQLFSVARRNVDLDFN